MSAKAWRPEGGRPLYPEAGVLPSPVVLASDRRLVVIAAKWTKGMGLTMRVITAFDEDAKNTTFAAHVPWEAVLRLTVVPGKSPAAPEVVKVQCATDGPKYGDVFTFSLDGVPAGTGEWMLATIKERVAARGLPAAVAGQVAAVEFIEQEPKKKGLLGRRLVERVAKLPAYRSLQSGVLRGAAAKDITTEALPDLIT
mgnify:CR=1 FL=1